MFFVPCTNLLGVGTAHFGIDLRSARRSHRRRIGGKPFAQLRNTVVVRVTLGATRLEGAPRESQRNQAIGVLRLGKACALHDVIDPVAKANDGVAFPGRVKCDSNPRRNGVPVH